MSASNSNTKTSPIAKLPLELFWRIFSLTCGEEHLKISTRDDQLWILRKVNSQWRISIDSSAQFWDRWMVQYPVEVSESAAAIRTQLCIDNSKTLPLYISVGEAPKVACSKALRNVFLSNIAHLSGRCINLNTPESLLKALIEHSGENKWPNLRKLSLDGGAADRIRGTNLIQELELNQVGISETEGLDLQHVRKLTFRSCRIASPQNSILYEIFKSAPNLEELTWVDSDRTWYMSDNSKEDPTILTVEKPLTLQNLRKLQLHTQKVTRKIFITPLFQAPNLTVLNINFSAKVPVRQSLADLAKRSNFRIRRLELTCTHLAEFSNYLELSYFAEVQELYLINCPSSPIWYPYSPPSTSSYMLHAMQSYSLLLPSLKRLQLHQEECLKFALINFIRSRYTRTEFDNSPSADVQQRKLLVTPLKYFKYSYFSCTEDEKKVLEEMRVLGRECGFEVVLGVLGG